LERRVVVTGIGLITPVAIGTEESWRAICQGKSGVGPITRFDASEYYTRIAAEVKGFDPLQWIEKRELRKMDTFIHYALAASAMALEDSGLKIDHRNAPQVGVYIGSGIGGLPSIERQHKILLESGPRRISPFFIPGLVVNLASGQVSIRHGAKGPNSAVCTACSTGSHAIGDSFRIIARGDAEAMITGGTESVITPLAIGGFNAMRAISTRNDQPEKASRPFDKNRDGFVVGEGAGILILESLEHAQGRGANIYAEVVGYGMSGDAFHISAPSVDGDGPIRVMQNTLKDAHIEPSCIEYINAHGTATPSGDVAETLAIKKVFGEYAQKVAISSTKSMIGHLLGAAGGVEAGISILAIRDQIIPPTINYETPDPDCDLDYVPNKARKATINYVLSNSFGFGGTNAALIFKRFNQ